VRPMRNMERRQVTEGKILLAHGSGGGLTHQLVREVFSKHLANPWLDAQEDAAVWQAPHACGRFALTTDSYVVQPLFFPGGDIGKLAVCGTVNDLAMVGAQALYLTAGFILEEGLPVDALERIVCSMAKTAEEAGVQVIAGDTKVVDHGSADQLFINTAGIGTVAPDVHISAGNAQPGDGILLSGPIGLHGMAIMCEREGLGFTWPLQSDCAPLNGLVCTMLAVDTHIHCLRDPTRGGLATTLCELATQSKIQMEIEESSIAIPAGVSAACEMLGLDPLYVANEGILVAIVPPELEASMLASMHAHPLGRNAALIGRVTSSDHARVVLHTTLGARRLLQVLAGEQLPRIC